MQEFIIFDIDTDPIVTHTLSIIKVLTVSV